MGEAAAAVLGALPEFAAVFAEEERLVFLRLVAENRAAAAEHFVRAERHGEVDLVERPVGPGAAVEPEFGGGEPRGLRGGGEGIAEHVETEAVGAVRIVEIAGCVDEVRLHLGQQRAQQDNVVGGVGAAAGCGVVKGQVEKV